MILRNSTLWQLWQVIQYPLDERNPLALRGAQTGFQINQAFGCILILGTFFLIVPVLILFSTVAGAITAAASAFAISREHNSDAFDLLAVTSEGTFGATWMLGMGAMHRRQIVARLQLWGSWALRIGFITAVFGLLDITLIAAGNFSVWDHLLLGLAFALFLVGFTIDHVQALTLGLLVGMLAPTVTPDRASAQVGAVAVYLLVRMMTLLIPLGIGFGVIPFALSWIPSMALQQLCTLLLTFALFVACNEGITRLIWSQTKQRLLTDPETLTRWGFPP
ncbi:MAG: hypothetical protein ACOYL5_17640 [Phototrophicaceae bacterium]|jgi:hypothetical protein